jgi:hypothetical protein
MVSVCAACCVGSVGAYHAGLAASKRSEVHRQFVRDDLQVTHICHSQNDLMNGTLIENMTLCYSVW